MGALDCRMHPLTALEFTSRIAKRAQYEAFEFTFVPYGIQVRNGSHANPSEHEYLVRVEDGIPVTCTCPADDRFEGACKHRVAIAIRRPLLDAFAAKAEPPAVAPDGGVAGEGPPSSAAPTTADASAGQSESSETDEACPDCIGEFPCWECYRAGQIQFD